MRYLARSMITSLALFVATSTKATDLRSVERSIAKQPTFETKEPRYAHLVFGPEAERSVWIVVDGHNMYVDLDADGDLTDEGERTRGEIVRDGLTRQRIFRARRVAERDGQWVDLEVALGLGDGPSEEFVSISIGGRPYQAAVADKDGTLEFAARVEDAPIIHFNGPMQVSPLPNQRLPRDGEAREFFARIGTPGLGKGTFAAISIDRVPANVHPVATVEFPRAKADRPPTQREFYLSHRC